MRRLTEKHSWSLRNLFCNETLIMLAAAQLSRCSYYHQCCSIRKFTHNYGDVFLFSKQSNVGMFTHYDVRCSVSFLPDNEIKFDILHYMYVSLWLIYMHTHHQFDLRILIYLFVLQLLVTQPTWGRMMDESEWCIRNYVEANSRGLI